MKVPKNLRERLQRKARSAARTCSVKRDPQGHAQNQTGNNYTYDAIGNLIGDAAEQIAQIDWTVYGKIKRIVRTNGSSKKNLEFNYDAQGNRISKRLYTSTGGGGVTEYQTTYYVRDAQGNVLATYEKDYQTSSPAITLKLQELNLYGSSRLGNIGVDELLTTTATGSVIPNVPVQKRELGDKNYELTNHLGNVIAVVSDRKLPIDLGGSLTPPDGTIDFFESDILQTKDYYAFGASMPGRDYQVSNYRYGFNGKENDNEVKGDGNQQDYGMRIYDNRLGRFLSVDPLYRQYPELTTYQFASNTPIQALDIDGLEAGVVNELKKDFSNPQLKVVKSYEISIHALQPDPGKNTPHVDGSIGHANVGLTVKYTDGSKVTTYVGFHPDGKSPNQPGILNKGVGTGEVMDEKNTVYYVKRIKEVTKQGFENALKAIENVAINKKSKVEDNRTEYDLQNFNCSDFAIKVYNSSGGDNVPNTKTTWKYMGMQGKSSSPGQLGEDLKTDKPEGSKTFSYGDRRTTEYDTKINKK